MALGKAALSFSGFLYKMEVRFATSIVCLSGMLLFLLGGKKNLFSLRSLTWEAFSDSLAQGGTRLTPGVVSCYTGLALVQLSLFSHLLEHPRVTISRPIPLGVSHCFKHSGERLEPKSPLCEFFGLSRF